MRSEKLRAAPVALIVRCPGGLAPLARRATLLDGDLVLAAALGRLAAVSFLENLTN
jgi:hypothetical protein